MDTRDKDIAAKREKARRYAREPGRTMLRSLEVTMQSEHAERKISLSGGIWTCTCDFYMVKKTCSHVMAVQEMLFDDLGIRQS